MANLLPHLDERDHALALTHGLVFVSRESHPGHREERSPSYHVRDVALARAREAGAVCVMSALFP